MEANAPEKGERIMKKIWNTTVTVGQIVIGGAVLLCGGGIILLIARMFKKD